MFDIKNSKDRLGLLKSDNDKLIKVPLDISLAEKALSDAWHLGDWVFSEEKTHDETLTKEKFRKNLYQDCPEMKILYDIANTIKHKKLNSPKAQIKVTKVHSGDFNSDYSNDFDISRLEIYFEDGGKIDAAELLEIAIKYWESVLLTE